MLVHCFVMLAMGCRTVRSVAVAYRQHRGSNLLLISVVALHEQNVNGCETSKQLAVSGVTMTNVVEEAMLLIVLLRRARHLIC